MGDAIEKSVGSDRRIHKKVSRSGAFTHRFWTRLVPSEDYLVRCLVLPGVWQKTAKDAWQARQNQLRPWLTLDFKKSRIQSLKK
jgi:hypothetical protein